MKTDKSMNGFDLQPHLSDSIVALRPLRRGDWEALYETASDPKIWERHPAHDRWRKPVFEAFFADALASHGALVAIDPDSGAVMGSSRFDTRRADPGEVEIGWTFLARRWWGGRVNPAMKRLMVGHALQSFTRVTFVAGEDNVPSRRALEKIGAVPTGKTHIVQIGGQPVRHVTYGIDRDQFAVGPLEN